MGALEGSRGGDGTSVARGIGANCELRMTEKTGIDSTYSRKLHE